VDSRIVILLHLIATVFMTGVIWIIQILHYPLFNMVGRENFAAYEAAHTNLITVVVMPAMLLELVFTVMIFFAPPTSVPSSLNWLNAVLLGVIWFSTAFLQVPQHSILSSGFDEKAYRMLVNSNWIRTVAWSAKAVIATAMVWMVMKS
jgi:uncharacterized membrane protein